MRPPDGRAWQREGVQEDQVRRRRFWMIAGVIAAGAILWLVATTYWSG